MTPHREAIGLAIACSGIQLHQPKTYVRSMCVRSLRTALQNNGMTRRSAIHK